MVTSTGMIWPACDCVIALYCLQNSMMLTPCGPSAVPTGGAGVAWPAGICSFTFVLKQPPAAELIRKAAGIEKGSGEPNRNKVGTLRRAQVKEIAEIKLPDLNAETIESAMRIIEGTARSMGVTVVD